MIAVPANRKLIILDLDSTLAVMRIDWTGMKQALGEAFRDVSFAQLSAGLREVAHRYGGAGLERCFQVIRRFEQDCVPGIEAIPEVLDLLDAHRGRARFAICSNNLHSTIADVLSALGLRDDFSVLVGRDDVAEGKPAPEGLLRILEELRVFPEDAVFIGNHESDARAGADAGIQTILIAS